MGFRSCVDDQATSAAKVLVLLTGSNTIDIDRWIAACKRGPHEVL